LADYLHFLYLKPNLTKMRGLKFIAFFFLLNLYNANSEVLDSLLLKADGYRISDTIRAGVLNSLAVELSSSDYEKGLKYADSAIVLSTAIKADKKLATAYFAKARNLSSGGDDSLAIINYQKAYLLYLKTGNFTACATSLQNMGISYYNLSDYSLAAERHSAALDIFKKVRNDRGTAAALNSLGIIAMEVADYTKAMELYFESLKLAKKIEDSTLLANSYSNIGIVYKNLGDLNKALVYQNIALQLNIKRQMAYETAKCYNNIAIVYSVMEQSDKAIESYNKALAINEKLKYSFGIASNYLNLGIELLATNKILEAYGSMKKAESLFKKIGDRNSEAVAIKVQSSLLMNAPDSILRFLKIPVSQRNTQCLSMHQKALEVFRETEDISNVADVESEMSTLYERMGDLKNSLHYFKEYSLHKDSMAVEDKKSEIERSELKFQFEAKEQQLKLENAQRSTALKEAEMKRKYYMAGSVCLLLLSGGAFVAYKQRKDVLVKKKEVELNAAVKESEFKALRLQMNPHFMFNSLNSIADFIDKNKSQTASDFAVKFSKLMRMILEYSEQQEITLKEEIDLLELYLKLESIRLSPKLNYHIDIDKEADADNILILPMLIQPFVENSIIHGITPLNNSGNIKISFLIQQNELEIVIDDDGVGMHAAKTTNERKSMAMKITSERIALYNEKYHANASLQLIALNPGTRVQLRMPLKYRY